MPEKVDNDGVFVIRREDRSCKTLRVHRLVPHALHGAETPRSSAAPAANKTALKANRPPGNDDDPGPIAA